MTDDTITRDELAAFYKRSTASAHEGSDYSLSAINGAAEEMADTIFASVAKHREPEYEPGVAYVDARGDNYLRSSTGGWVDYSTTWHPHALPARPLRRLIPEDIPLPEPKITCAACRHTAPSISEVAWQPDWKQWRCTDPAACHKRQQEAGMEGDDLR